MALAALIFDLDGTLVDSRTDLATAINVLRTRLGLPPHAEAAIGTMIGEGARKLLHRAMDDDIGPERTDELYPDFLAAYDAVCTDCTRPYAGVPELLAHLQQRRPDLPLSVLTNKPEAMSHKVLAALGMAATFRAVIGGDTLPVRKPDPAGLREILTRMGMADAPPDRVMLIGDSPIDAKTAVAAGCQLGLCYWGFSEPSDLDIHPATIRAHSVAELQAALDPLL